MAVVVMHVVVADEHDANSVTGEEAGVNCSGLAEGFGDLRVLEVLWLTGRGAGDGIARWR
jgi:hypothetical protein